MNDQEILQEIEVRYTFPSIQDGGHSLTSSIVVFDLLWTIWDCETIAYQERFYLIFLNRKNDVIGYKCLSVGGLSATVVDMRHLLGIALKCNAAGIILAHIHPSGALKPSDTDRGHSKEIAEAAKLLDITLIDHLILVPQRRYYSFANDHTCSK